MSFANYLGFFSWFHNLYPRSNEEPMGEPDWETPDMVRIKNRKSRRVSPYPESDIWDLEEVKTLIKYELYQRNRAAIFTSETFLHQVLQKL